MGSHRQQKPQHAVIQPQVLIDGVPGMGTAINI